MPDITMCASETCEVRQTCCRNEASGTKPNGARQSWFMTYDNRKCHYYWHVEDARLHGATTQGAGK